MPDDRDLARRAALVHREVLQIAALILIAVAGFLVTRAVAGRSRDATLRDAEIWYARGEAQLADGRIEEAIASLRRAAVRNRFERRYALALARALARKNDTDAARAALLTLREAAPEDAEINLELARLAARRQDVTEGVRFYRNAMYALWPVEAAETRRQVRFEFIEFLLQYEQTGRARSELLALASDLPDQAGIRIRAGQLFARAGDAAQALSQFERAIRIAPDNESALTGAGLAAFTLRDFNLTRRYLARVTANSDDVPRMRDIAGLVVSNDPLARGIGAAERRRRLAANLSYLRQRRAACMPQIPAGTASPEATPLERETAAFERQVNLSVALDQDAIEAGVDLFDRIEQEIANACGPPTPRDQALRLIARQHTTNTR